MQVMIKKQAVNLLKTFIFPIAVYVVILIVTLLMGKMGYVSSGAFDRIVRGSVLTTITAYAIALPLSGGRWDFAPGIIIMLAGIIGSNLTIDLGLGPVMLLAITVGVAVLLSLVEGLLYLWIRVPTLIVSLGVVMMYEAVSGLVYGGSGSQLFMHANLTIFARPPLIYILLALIMVAFYFLLSHTRFGYDTRSLSAHPKLAVNMGVKEKKNILLTYLVVGVLLGIAAVLNASTVLVSPAGNLSSTALMFSSMAPVLMGLYLAQFTNLSLGIFAGALGMNALSYGMVVLGINSSLQSVVIGVFIVGFMAFTTNQERIRSFLGRTKAGSKASA